MDPSLDLLSACRAGMVLRTRDRREARITSLDPAAGLIQGEVEMKGACVWRADGRWRNAPFGAPGPLDLMAPLDLMPAEPTPAGEPPASAPATASIKGALDPANRLFCCD